MMCIRKKTIITRKPEWYVKLEITTVYFKLYDFYENIGTDSRLHLDLN